MKRFKTMIAAVFMVVMAMAVPASAATLKMNVKTATVKVGQTMKVSVSGSSKTVSWKSSNSRIASVKKTGKNTALITGIKKGSAQITAAASGRSVKCRVTVKKPNASDLTVLLAGSSTFQMWKNAADTFSPYKTVNVAIGGTRTEYWLENYKSLIVSQKPSAVVIYVGANDIGSARQNPKKVAKRVETLITNVQKSLPNIPVFYVSINASVKKANNGAVNIIKQCNALVSKWCSKKKDVYYIDTFPIFYSNGTIQANLLRTDGIHPNADGYDLIAKAVGPVVKKVMKAKYGV